MPTIEPIIDFVFTSHALLEMARRNVGKEEAQEVLAKPEQVEMVRRAGRFIKRNMT
jgi:hypothetical protein